MQISPETHTEILVSKSEFERLRRPQGPYILTRPNNKLQHGDQVVLYTKFHSHTGQGQQWTTARVARIGYTSDQDSVAHHFVEFTNLHNFVVTKEFNRGKGQESTSLR